MQRDCLRLEPELPIADAEARMRATGARHAAVVDAGRLVGVVSHRDLLEAMTMPGTAARVADVMRPDPWTAPESTTLTDAARLMLRRRVGCLPVLGSGPRRRELVGLVAEADLLRAAYL